VHGDYRPGNMAFAPDGAVRAVYDWELATLGDPGRHLGRRGCGEAPLCWELLLR
jgi:aminoglycoside phosphotransferase (APT) family kinase protein